MEQTKRSWVFKTTLLVCVDCIVCFTFCLYPAGAQENDPRYKPRERNLLIDIPLTIVEDTAVNLFGNVFWRLFGPDSEVAYFTADSIRANLNPRVWDFELGQGGDIFLVNQFLHPYAGGIYFASARSNNFGFYESILSSAFGSFSWEALGEAASPAMSDVINTVGGGIALGEILHRLYLELDKTGGGGKVAATVLSPTDRITAALRGYGPAPGPGRIYDASFAFGFSWSNAQFLEQEHVDTTWHKPSVFIGADLVYSDPFIQHSKTPFDHFEFQTMLNVSSPLMYNFNFISDGYLASWLLLDDEKNQMSGGLSLHFDDYIVDKNLDMNNGTENVSFNANSVDYTLKWRHRTKNNFAFSFKFHLGFTPWAVADYNGGINRDDYNCYLLGVNTKIAMQLQDLRNEEKPGQSVTLNLRLYDTWSIPKTLVFTVNAIFFESELNWVFPLTRRISLYAADSFSILHFNMEQEADAEFPNVSRWYNCARLGLCISL
ncbi:MAG: DUF3943 domain-containing protein [Treponema sp.]|nr:DUF3943 domain-containing protein [Treponema sp.]